MKILNIPLHLQHPDSTMCVPYGLAGIAHYYGIKVTKEQMVKACRTHRTQGTQTEDITRAAKKFGLKLERIKFQFDIIKKSIDQGHPIILCHISEVSGRIQQPHFNTIIGARKDRRKMGWYTL